MADIAMCKGIECPIRETCYRFTAPRARPWQSELSTTPFDHQTASCSMFKAASKRVCAQKQR